MKYIIDEEELKILVNINPQHGEWAITNFLKDKQPVVEVASGEVICDYRCDDAFRLNNKPVSYYFEDYASGLEGTNIKIYIEVKDV